MESILVLEDDENFRALLADTLGDEGYEVTEAASAEEAIACAQKQPFHLILSDVRMAGPLDGVGAIEKIKKVQPGIRSIVLTGFADREVPVRAAKIQADDYLLKPLEAGVLLSVVQLVLSREKGADPSLLMKLLQAPGKLAQVFQKKAHSEQVLRLLEDRERFMQRFFLLIRSHRLSLEEAYPLYLLQLETEEQHLTQASPESAYTTLESQLLSILVQEKKPLPQPKRPYLPKEQFRTFFVNILEGRVDSTAFSLAGRLLLDLSFRRANLANYLAYHESWTSKQADLDPFIGVTIDGYTLTKARPGTSRSYEVSSAEGGYLAIVLPETAEAEELLADVIQGREATLLGRLRGHQILLIKKSLFTLQQRIPPEGLTPIEAWKLVRPVFLEVEAYHQRGIYSGYFSAGSLEILPGSTQPSFTHFGPEQALWEIRRRREIPGGAHCWRGGMAPEISSASVNEPCAASDQPPLSTLFTALVLGGNSQRTPIHLCFLGFEGNQEQNPAWSAISDRLGNLSPILYRMRLLDLSKRFPNLSQVIEAIDKAVEE